MQRLTGVSSSDLSLIERGDRSPGVNLLNKLAVLYGVDPNELLHRANRLGSGDPEGWSEPPELRATVVRQTRGFGTPASFPISGFRGGFPRR